MMLANVLSVWVISLYLIQNALSVANERKRVFKFTKVNNMQMFSNRENVGKPPIDTNSKSVLCCATILMQYGPFTCMEYYKLQDQCRSNNGGSTVQSLTNDMNNGWSLYNVESLGNSAGSLQKSKEECKLDNIGRDYRGKKKTTKEGTQCMIWSATSPHTPGPNVPIHFSNTEEPDTIKTNYCRNPDNSTGGPWCYTMDPNTRWQYCGVPYCQCYT